VSGGPRAPLPRRSALAAGLTAALSGCGVGRWLGEAEEAPLPGERRAVLLLEEEVRADPAVADLPVRLPRPRRNEAWAQNGGVATHAMQHLESGDTLARAWTADIGSGAGRRTRLLAPPVAAGGAVFTVDTDDEVAAFDAAGGRELWRRRVTDGRSGDRLTTGGLAHDAGRLYVTGGAGDVAALDAATGAEVWRTAVKAPVRAAPTVSDGRLLVLAADNQLFAIDAAGGEIAWRHAGVFEQAGILGGASPAAAGGLVIAAYSSGEVFALELASGRPLWSDTVLRPRRTLAIGAITDIIGDPVIDRDRVIVAGVSGEMVALDVARGERVWETAIASTQMPWVAGEVLYLLTERNELACLLRADGRIRWVSPLGLYRETDDPDSGRVRWAGPILVGDRLLIAGTSGEALSVSPYTGEVLGRVPLPGPVGLPPIAAAGTVYLLTDEGELVAFR
jgi:outer membrane protein assembly factor BamB